MTDVLDLPALLLAITIALVITVVLIRAHAVENHRRGWITAGILAAVLTAVGVIDLLRVTPRETNIATVIVGAALPVFGALGMIRATRGVRPWIRWPLVFLTAFVLLFGGLLIGATFASRLLPI
jgi:hypothetical protein